MELGMVGLGRMGANMAQRLARAGHVVAGFDPGEAARQAASEAGITPYDSLKALVQARGHIAELADLAPGIQAGEIGAFMGPTQALGRIRQRGHLGRVRAALETVGEDAMPDHWATTASPTRRLPPSRMRAHNPPIPRIAL